jgi:hypothetical protein
MRCHIYLGFINHFTSENLASNSMSNVSLDPKPHGGTMVVMLKWQRSAQQRVLHSFHAFQYFFWLVVHT